jgi:hypothetical protein
MTPEAFRHYWMRTYPDCPPAGFRLRTKYQAQWFRIHSLPESKRYAENESEYQEILRRQNAVLTDTLGNGQPFVLVSAGYSDAPTPVEMWPAVAAHYSTSHHFLTVHMNDASLAAYWHYFIHEAKWTPGLVDAVLRQVADDEIRNILFVSMQCQSIFAPYDGGADIILPFTPDRDAMRCRYAEWLSAHPLGL